MTTTHTGMRVRVHLAEPLVYMEDDLHLDGLVALGAYRDLSPSERDALPSISGEWAVDFPLPLARHAVQVTRGACDDRLRDDEGRVWVFVASAELLPWAMHSSHQVRKRIAAAEMARYTTAKTVHSSLGPGKAYDLVMPTVFSPIQEWIAVGDIDEVRRLLETHVTGIGKRTCHGNGRVLRWEVERDESVTVEVVLRARRVPCIPLEATGLGGIRPPYHHASRRCPFVGPAREVAHASP